MTMSAEDRWALFAAHALSGLMANSSDGFPREAINWAKRAAELADELAAEFAARGGRRAPPPPVRELPHWGSTRETVPRDLHPMPIQSTREAAGRALEALSARAPAPTEPDPSEADRTRSAAQPPPEK